MLLYNGIPSPEWGSRGGRGEGLWIIIGLVARVKKEGGGGCLGRSNKVKKLRLLTAKVCRRMT